MAEDTLVIKINGNVKDFQNALDNARKETKDLEKSLNTIAKQSAIAFVGLAASITLNVKAFADYEKALIGVGKTTNLSGAELKKLGESVRKLSNVLPTSTNELLNLTQIAAQLGVKGNDNLLKFTETVARLGTATNLSGEEAAVALARILNVTGESVGTVDRLGAAMVALGNNFAASESEIARMTTEVTRATSVFGVSAAEAAGLATALKSVGVRAELGGSVIGRAMRAIEEAIRKGGAEMQNLQLITGLTGDKLTKTFKDDATSVFQRFIEGLGKIQVSGGSVAKTLEDLGLAGDEINKVLPVIAKRSDILSRAISLSNSEFEKNTALIKESDIANKSFSSQFNILKNQFVNVTAIIGQELAPSIAKMATSVKGLFQFIQDNREFAKLAADSLLLGAKLTGTIAVVAGAAAGLFKLRTALVAARLATAKMNFAVKALIGSTGLGLLVAFAPEIIGVVKDIWNAFSGGKEVPKDIKKINSELDTLKDKEKELQAFIDERNGKMSAGAKEQLARIKREIVALTELKTPLDAEIETRKKATAVKKAEAKALKEKNARLKTEGLIIIANQKKITAAEEKRKVLEKEREQESKRKIKVAEDESARILEVKRKQNEQLETLAEERAVLEEERRLLAEEEEFIRTDENFNKLRENLGLEEAIRIQAQENLLTQQKNSEDKSFKMKLLDSKKKVKLSQKTANDLVKTEKLKSATTDQMLQASANALSAFGQLAATQGGKFFALQKALALAQIPISIAQGIAEAQKLGFPANLIQGAAVAAIGAAQLITVSSQKKPTSFARGGVVTGGVPGVDSVPILAQRNEIVSPAQNFDELIGSVRAKREAEKITGDEEGGASGITEVLIGFTDNAFEVIEQKLLERRAIGIGNL